MNSNHRLRVEPRTDHRPPSDAPTLAPWPGGGVADTSWGCGAPDNHSEALPVLVDVPNVRLQKSTGDEEEHTV